MGQYQQQLAGAVDPNLPMPEPPSLLANTPLEWLEWYNPLVHKQELLKWANSDRMRELFTQLQPAKEIIKLHLQDIEQATMRALMQQQALTAPPKPGGAGMAMQNSNRESTQGNEPSGTGQGAQNSGPA
jgi:hypothetical protein